MREDFTSKKRIVIKVGTSSLTYPNKKINYQKFELLSRTLADLQNRGKEVILVTSGAIAVGTTKLGRTEPMETLPEKQAAAAIGQVELIKIYDKIFSQYQQIVAQVLITKDAFMDEGRRTNAKNTLMTLLKMGIIPIINENDTVATEEIEFGDNDRLSAYIAVLVEADMLILLSDIDGLYSADPKKDAEAQIIPAVYDISPEIEALATGSSSKFAKGGMITKIMAARICTDAGIETIITNGDDMNNIYEILDGKEVGTLFVANKG